MCVHVCTYVDIDIHSEMQMSTLKYKNWRVVQPWSRKNRKRVCVLNGEDVEFNVEICVEMRRCKES